jgi:hypothetical protein
MDRNFQLNRKGRFVPKPAIYIELNRSILFLRQPLMSFAVFPVFGAQEVSPRNGSLFRNEGCVISNRLSE